MRAAASAPGTNRTKWAGLTVSAYRGRPEVTGEAYKARNPSRLRYHSCCLTVVVTTGRIQYALHRQPVPNRRLVLRRLLHRCWVGDCRVARGADIVHYPYLTWTLVVLSRTGLASQGAPRVLKSFYEPILLPNGKQLVTLRNAALSSQIIARMSLSGTFRTWPI